MNITDTQITAQLLTAAREGKITATIIDAQTLPPLAGGDGADTYPATIALQIDTGEPDLSETPAAIVITTGEGMPTPGEISIKLYAGTHCGQPQFAFEGDENERVYDDAADCATEARGRLEELFAAAIEEQAKGDEEDDYGDYRIVADREEKTVTIYSDEQAILENDDAMEDVEKARRYAFGGSSKWTNARGCSVDNDHGWQWGVTGHGMEIDEDALHKQERQAAEALTASLKEDE